MDKTNNEYSKTPISTLQEYCQKLGKTPQYDLICSEGRAHQPQFVYTCKVGEFTSTGKGGSKKQAKHEAAQKVLQALTQILNPHDKALSSRLQVMTPFVPRLDPDETNPVGSLQELVVSRGWRLPEYTLANENGPAHKKEFRMKCRVENMQQFGEGSAKKHAKRRAAVKMFKFIVGLPNDAKENVTSHCKEATNKTEPHELLNSEFKKLVIDEEAETVADAREKLDVIGRRNNFEATYHNVCDKKTEEGNSQCFLHIGSLNPPMVVYGLGETMEEANIYAAEEAIENIETAIDCY